MDGKTILARRRSNLFPEIREVLSSLDTEERFHQEEELKNSRNLTEQIYWPLGGGRWGQSLPPRTREYHLKQMFGEMPTHSLILRLLSGNFSFIVDTVPYRDPYTSCC